MNYKRNKKLIRQRSCGLCKPHKRHPGSKKLWNKAKLSLKEKVDHELNDS